MAAEWWSPPSDLTIRLPACGHTMLEHEQPSYYVSEGSQMFDCPICGTSQRPALLSTVRDGVPTAQMGWGRSKCKLRLALGNIRQNEAKPKSLEGLLRSMSTPSACRITLASATIKLGKWVKKQRPAGGLVLRAWPAGCTIVGGSILLDSAAILLTGHGAAFYGTTFKGPGLVVCCGKSFSAHFHSCHFQNCSLYAVHGAAVSLRRCAFALCSIALVASGRPTCANLHSCTWHGCATAIIAECGASTTAHQCRVRYSHCAVIALHSGTHFLACASAIEGSTLRMPAGAVLQAAIGVVVEGAHVILRRCSVEGSKRGVHVTNTSAALEVHNSRISARSACVVTRACTTVMLRNTTMLLCKPPPCPDPSCKVVETPANVSLCGGDDGACTAQIVRCSMRTTGQLQHGVVALRGAAASMLLSTVHSGASCATASGRGSFVAVDLCMLRSRSQYGCGAVGRKARATVRGGRVCGVVCAVHCEKGGAVTVRGAALRGLNHAGCAAKRGVQVGGVARLYDCSVEAAACGVFVAYGTVIAHRVSVSNLHRRNGTAMTGYSHHGGPLVVTGGCIKGCEVGVNACLDPAERREAEVSMSGVRFEDNKIDVCVGSKTSLNASGCIFSCAPVLKSGGGAGVACVQQGRAVCVWATALHSVIRDSTFAGYVCGVESHGKHGTEVAGCTFECNTTSEGPSICVLMQDFGTVRDCVFDQAEYGVGVVGQGVTLQGNTFRPGVRLAVSVTGGGAAASHCCLDGCDVGFNVIDGGRLEIADCECVGVDIGLNMSGASSVRAVRLNVRGGCGGAYVCSEDGATASAQLKDCVFVGLSGVGVSGNGSGVCVSVERCEVREYANGVVLTPGAKALIVGTLIACRYGARGVVVGAADDIQEHCGCCGLSGWAAAERGWDCLSSEGGAGAENALCMHDGAYALATLRDVIIQDGLQGVCVGGAGRVHAERVVVRRAEAPYTTTRIGLPSTFERCTAIGSREPLVAEVWVLGAEGGLRRVPEELRGVEVVEEQQFVPEPSSCVSSSWFSPVVPQPLRSLRGL